MVVKNVMTYEHEKTESKIFAAIIKFPQKQNINRKKTCDSFIKSDDLSFELSFKSAND